MLYTNKVNLMDEYLGFALFFIIFIIVYTLMNYFVLTHIFRLFNLIFDDSFSWCFFCIHQTSGQSLHIHARASPKRTYYICSHFMLFVWVSKFLYARPLCFLNRMQTQLLDKVEQIQLTDLGKTTLCGF